MRETPKSPRVVHIPTGTRCNNRCSFCMERSQGYPFEHSVAEYRAHLARMRAEIADVVFTGGEPTLNHLLPELVAHARDLRYEVIGLVTNGRALSNWRLCERLLNAGLNQITVSIHAPNAEVHDAITRRPGSFAQALRGLQNLSKLRAAHAFSLRVNVTLVRSNLHSMREMAELAWGLGAEIVNFNVVEPRGNADDLFASVVPRYSDVLEHADASGLDFNAGNASLSRVPACMGGTDWVQETWHITLHAGDIVYDPEVGKAKGPPCEQCALTDRCPGVWALYAERYGWDECIPVVEPVRRQGQVWRVLSGSTCNNHCVHCVEGPAAASPPKPSLSRELRAGILRGYRRLALAGGELLLDERGPTWIRQARDMGYEEVTLETNARVLNIDRVLDRLAETGLFEVVVRVNAGSAEAHDEMARVPGAFRQTVKGLLRLKRRGIPFSLRLIQHPKNEASVDLVRELARHTGATRLEVIG